MLVGRCVSSLLLRLLVLVTRWLKRPLHHYLSFSKDRPFLKLGFTGFTLRFEQLRLLNRGWNEEFLKAAIPFQFHSVLIESFSVRCGVFSPVTVEAKGLYFVLKTSNEKHYDAEAEKKRRLEARQRRLEALQFDGEGGVVSSPGSGWVRRQLVKLGNSVLFGFIKRLQVTVTSVHVRLEDELSQPASPISAGLAVESLTVRSKQELNDVEVQGVSLYWNCAGNQELLSHSSEAAAIDKLRGFPFQGTVGYDYIVRPTVFSGEVQLQRGTLSYFDASLNVQCKSSQIQTTEQQLKSILELLSFFKQQEHFRCFLQYRPSSRPISKANAKEWWQFAYHSVVKYMREKRGQSIWDQLKFHKRLHKEYSDLYEKSLVSEKANKKLKNQLKAMEDEMKLLEIVVWRSKVWRRLRLRRLIQDLARYDKKPVKKVPKGPTSQMSLVSLCVSFAVTDVELLLTKATAVDDDSTSDSDSVVLKLEGSGVEVKAEHNTLLSSFLLDTNKVTLSSGAGTSSRTLFQPTSRANDRPMLSVSLAMSHQDTSSARSGELAAAVLYDHYVKMSLLPSVFCFDRKVVVDLAGLATSLGGSFNTDLKLYVKEQAYELKYQGERRARKMVANRESICVEADVELPTLVFPSSSVKNRSSNIVIKPGHLDILTSQGDRDNEKVVVEYEAKLTSLSVAFTPQGKKLSVASVVESLSKSARSSVKVLSCPDAGVSATVHIPLQLDAHIIPKVKMEAVVTSFDIMLSNSTVEVGVASVSYYLDTLQELLGVLSQEDGGPESEGFHKYVAKPDLSEGRLMEVANGIGSQSTPISKQSLARGRSYVEEIDYGDSTTDDTTMLEASCHIKKVSLELTSEVGSFFNYLGGSVEDTVFSVRQTKDSLQCHLDVLRVCLIDSAITNKGVEVRIPNPLLVTQLNKSGKFFSANLCLADPSDPLTFMIRYQSVRTSVSLDIGPLDVSVFDSSLTSWTEVAVQYYQQASTIDFSKLAVGGVSAEVKTPSPKTSPKRPEKRAPPPPITRGRSSVTMRPALNSRPTPVSLSVSLNMKAFVVSLLARDMALVKMSVTGVTAELRDTTSNLECIGSVDTMVMLDCLQGDDALSKVVSSHVNEKVLKFKITKRKSSLSAGRPRALVPTLSRPTLDPEALTASLRADITVGGVSCVLLYQFINTMQRYFVNVATSVSKAMAPLTFSKTVSSEDTSKDTPAEPFKIYLSVNVHTISVKLPPGRRGSSEALQLQLDSLLLSNKYNGLDLSGAGGTAYQAVGETMQLDFHQLTIARMDGEDLFELLSMPEFGVSLTRIITRGIPLQALRSEPQFKVSFSADILEMYASTHDLFAVLRILRESVQEDAYPYYEMKPVESGLLVKAAGDEAPSEERDSTLTTEKEEPAEPASARDLLQLDASLKRVKWTVHYVEASNSLPVTAKHLVRTLTVELAVQEIMLLLDLAADVSVKGDAWVTDFTAKELPNNRAYNSLGKEDSYIVHQELYYRKTKPPKLGGGTMDTRRASREDNVLKISFEYSKEGINVNLLLQHIHTCLWPHLISPFLKLATRHASSEPHPPTQPKHQQRAEEDATNGGMPRVELNVKLNNVSLVLLDKPSDMTSYGVCAEIVSPAPKEFSKAKILTSDSELLLSTDPLFFEASVIHFGRKVAKLVQVVEPCSLAASYHMKKQPSETEELISVSASPIVVAVSMETISTLTKPVLMVIRDGNMGDEGDRVRTEPSDSEEDRWELKSLSVAMEMPLPPISTEEELEALADSVEEAPAEKAISRKQKAELHLPDVVLRFDLITAGSSNSLLSLTTMVEAAATDWSGNVNVDAQLEVSGYVYNQRVVAWEPLLEPLEDVVKDKYRRWGAVLKVRHIDPDPSALSPVFSDKAEPDSQTCSTCFPVPSHTHPSSSSSSFIVKRPTSSASEALEGFVSPLLREGEGERKSSLALLITSDDRLELTMSPGALETLLKFLNASKLNESAIERNLAGCSPYKKQPMLVRNQTGLDIAIFPGATFSLGDASFIKRIDLSPSEAPICGTPDPSIAGGLASVTMAIPFVGEVLDPETQEKDKARRGSSVNLRYVDANAKRGGGGGMVFVGTGGDYREEGAGEMLEEWTGLLSYLHEVGSEMESKASSLTKLRDYLQQRRGRGKDAYCSPSRRTSMADITSWRPKRLDHMIRIQAKGGRKSNPIPVSLPGLIPVPLYDFSFTGVGVSGRKLVGVCEVEDVNGTRVVTIRSSVQIKNELSTSVTLYAQTSEGAAKLSVLRSGDSFSLPMSVFVDKTPLKIGMGDGGYFSEDVLDWSTVITDVGRPVYISCPTDLSSRRKYHLQAVARDQPVVSQSHLSRKFFVIALKPSLVLHNLLPMAIQISGRGHHRSDRHSPAPPLSPRLRRSSRGSSPGNIPGVEISLPLAKGEKKSVDFLDPSREQDLTVEVPDYRGLKWKGTMSLQAPSENQQHTQVKLLGHNQKGDQVAKMKVGVYTDRNFPSLYRLYSPYWICNKSGLRLEYEYYSSKLHKVKGLVDDGKENSVSLVYFKPSVENKDRKLKVRLAGDGQLSKNIYLSNTGEAMDVSTKSKDGTVYELSVEISYSLNVLTQVVHILPKYIVHNLTQLKLGVTGFSEKNKSLAKEKLTLDPNEAKPFWPSSHRACVLSLQREGDLRSYTSKPFLLTRVGTLSLALDTSIRELPVVTVKVSPDSSGSYVLITLSPYSEGAAAYRVENYSRKLNIKLRQSGSSVGGDVVIPAGHSQLYMWDNPLLEWQLQWQVVGEGQDTWTTVEEMWTGSRRVGTSLNSKGDDVFEGRASEGAGSGRVFWRVMYDNSQRVLQLFDTAPEHEVTPQGGYQPLQVSSEGGVAKSANLQLICSLEGVGVSLINDRPVEVVYCSIQSSPVVWLRRNSEGGRFRPLDEAQSLKLEATWRSGKSEVDLDSEIFDLEKLASSRGGALMRTFNPGFWGSVSVMDTHFAVSVKVGRVQVDNQLQEYALDNRIVFAAEQMLSAESVISPMVEAAVLVRRPSASQQITIYENAYLKVKNSVANVELGMVAALLPLVQPVLSPQESPIGEIFSYDAVEKALMSSANLVEMSKGTRFGSDNLIFQNLAIDPIKVTATYTTVIAGPYDLSGMLGNLLGSLLQISGSFTNGVIPIRLDSLKFTGESVSLSELYTLIWRHYRNEALSQIHSVIFGLDIIGNPSMLFKNFELGVSDLVDKSRAGFERSTAVSGVTGVAVGVKELLGHVIEGSSGSLVSTTGSFRNTLLATTDLDYKRRHRQLSHESAETLGANLLLGTRFFAEGLLGGLTDIFLKPLTGASTGGAKGFFQGVGQGALSILTKPTLGVVDLAYFTLEGIRSFADDDVEVQPVRLPRLVRPNKIVMAYSSYEAQGLGILWRTQDHNKDTMYYGHCWLPEKEGRDPRVLLINSLNILKLAKCGKFFKVDDLNIKLEYLQEWKVESESDDRASVFFKYGDDSKIEKIGSFFGIGKPDHHAEVVDQTAVLNIDSPQRARLLACQVTEACEGVLLYYTSLMANS